MNIKEPAKCCHCGSYLSIDPAQAYTKCGVCGRVDETENMKNAFLLVYVPRCAEENPSVQQEILRRLTNVELMLRSLSDEFGKVSEQLVSRPALEEAPALQEGTDIHDFALREPTADDPYQKTLPPLEDALDAAHDVTSDGSDTESPLPDDQDADTFTGDEEQASDEEAYEDIFGAETQASDEEGTYEDIFQNTDKQDAVEEKTPRWKIEMPDDALGDVPDWANIWAAKEYGEQETGETDPFAGDEQTGTAEETYDQIFPSLNDADDSTAASQISGVSEPEQQNPSTEPLIRGDEQPVPVPTVKYELLQDDLKPAFFRQFLPGDPDDPTEAARSESFVTSTEGNPVAHHASPEVRQQMISSIVSSASPEEFEMIMSLPEPVSLYDVPREQWNQLESIFIPGDFMCEEGQFKGFRELRRVVFAEGVKLVQPSMFEDCVSLQEVVLPEGMYGIFTAAFRNCTSLIALYCPSTLSQIGKSAFAGCTSLKKVQFRSCVTVGIEAFKDCTALEMVACLDVTMPDVFLPDNMYHPNRRERMNTIIKLSEQTHDHEEYMLIYNSYPDLFIYPDHYIPEKYEPYTHQFSMGCFKNCTSLFSMDIPFGITHIEYDAFAGCRNLSYLYVPPTLSVLNGHAMIGCPHAKAYYYNIEINA